MDRFLRDMVRSALWAITLGALMMYLISVPAAAHPGPEPETGGQRSGDQTDRQHAADDLLGTSVSAVERTTRSNAARIARATGVRPGARTRSRSSSEIERRSTATAGDPAQGGAWSPVVGTDVVPVFTAVLPSGKVLIWDSVGDGPAESSSDHSFTRAMVWNPADDSHRRVDVTGYNIFCAGFTHLPNGNVLVAGGNQDKDLRGLRQTHIFDWKSETWSRGPDMSAERWYPSLAALGTGEAVIVGGGSSTAEVYQVDNTVRRLTGFTSFAERVYPFLVSRPDGQVELVGPRRTMHTMTTAGSGALTATRTRDGIWRDYGSFATYGVGLTMVAGGGDITEGGRTHVPTRTANVVNTLNGSTTRWTNPMATGRRQFNLTVLADGSVLATGGQSSSVDGLVDLDNAVFAAERWDPATGAWTTLAPAARVRQYHSSATLLPDGRVLTGGGGICGICVTKGYLERNIEYFTPPHLFRSGGGGEPAARPVVDSAPASVAVGQSFTISSAQAPNVRKVGLVGLGAATHGVDQGQRYVPLSFSYNPAAGGTLSVTAPASGNVAPPGYYMMFVVDDRGVPSVASMIKVEAPTVSPTTKIRGFQGRCVDVAGGSSADGTALLMWSCHSGANQNWTPVDADSSLRSLGKCMDVRYGHLRAGAVVQLWSCNGTNGQRWDRRPDGTIRLRSNAALCLTVRDGSTANGSGLQIRTCAGLPYQQWTW